MIDGGIEFPAAPHPLTAAEDRVRAFYDSCSEFDRATLRWLLGCDGWTDSKALAVRQREWRRCV